MSHQEALTSPYEPIPNFCYEYSNQRDVNVALDMLDKEGFVFCEMSNVDAITKLSLEDYNPAHFVDRFLLAKKLRYFILKKDEVYSLIVFNALVTFRDKEGSTYEGEGAIWVKFRSRDEFYHHCMKEHAEAIMVLSRLFEEAKYANFEDVKALQAVSMREMKQLARNMARVDLMFD